MCSKRERENGVLDLGVCALMEKKEDKNRKVEEERGWVGVSKCVEELMILVDECAMMI